MLPHVHHKHGIEARHVARLMKRDQGRKPNYLPASETGDWTIQIPAWCADQRNQMTGPGDDAELVVKMLNSGAPGVMLDLEDSLAWQQADGLFFMARMFAKNSSRLSRHNW